MDVLQWDNSLLEPGQLTWLAMWEEGNGFALALATMTDIRALAGATTVLLAACTSPTSPAALSYTLVGQDYLYFCGGWDSSGAPPVTRTIMDVEVPVLLGGSEVPVLLNGSFDAIDKAALSRILATGAREVLPRFHVALIRLELDVAAVDGLYQSNSLFYAQAVPDLSNHDVFLFIAYDRIPTTDDLQALAALGARSISAYSFSTIVGAAIDDARIPAVRALPHLTFADVDGPTLCSTTTMRSGRRPAAAVPSIQITPHFLR